MDDRSGHTPSFIRRGIPLALLNVMQPLIIFTDLDGTLLDHDSYSWQPAANALARIEALGIPLILNTSKTIAEVISIRAELNNQHPFIIENGGAVCTPPGYFGDASTDGDFSLQVFGQPYQAILKILNDLRKARQFNFQGFADMTNDEVAELTGLNLEEADQAKKRSCSEPIIWKDSEQRFETFSNELKEHDLQVISGGRFFHIMGITDKGLAMEWLLAKYKSMPGNADLASIALGDSPNDRPMLERSDYAVVVKNIGGSMILERTENVTYTDEAGPSGWQIAIDNLLDQLGD